MSEPSTRRARSWNVRQWGLRWKVAAVVAVPLIAAILLGAMQVTSAVQEASRLQRAAQFADVIPVIVDLNGVAGRTAGGQISGSVTDRDLTDFDGFLSDARSAVARRDLYPDAKGAIERMIETAQMIRSTGKQPGRGLPEYADVLHRLADDTERSIDSIVDPMDDKDVNAAATELKAVQATYRPLRDEVLTGVQMLIDPKDSGQGLVAASGGELAMLDSLVRSYPQYTPQVDKLRTLNTERVQTVLDSRRANRNLPVEPLRDSLIASQNTYTDLTRGVSDSIVSIIDGRVDQARSVAIRDVLIVLAALVIATLLAIVVAYSLLSPLRRLRRSALQVARVELPNEIERIKSGEQLDAIEVSPVPVHTTEEIGQVARAVDDMHGQALRLAGEQAQLRVQINDMFETLSRRNKSLVDHQLQLIESLEHEEKDPGRLDSLFRLDHIAARMRRNSDNLLILAGTQSRHGARAAVQLGDVLRGALSEVEDYRRVRLGAIPDAAVTGAAAGDVVHMIAELLDNALRASPPTSEVSFDYSRTDDGGVRIDIADQGIGVPPEQLGAINSRLGGEAVVSTETARRMGLYVVATLARRHGISVQLRPTSDAQRNAGVTAGVQLPAAIVTATAAAVRPTPPVPAPTDAPASRDADAEAAPRPQSAPSGLPQRTPGAARFAPAQSEPTEAPVETVAPQRASSLPQRDTGLPQRTSGLPQRTSGLPQRQPGLPQRTPDTATPQRHPQPVGSASGPAVPDRTAGTDESAQQRFRTQRTASFFTSRLEGPPERPHEETPIYGEMVSAWLADGDNVDFDAADVWNSKADAGWTAARMATEATVQTRTVAGLPKRDPGGRLIPGTVSGVNGGQPRTRDPEAVRTSLGRHQRGVRDGRDGSNRSSEGDR